ncbi:MAG: sulfite exporter TauE/SafE family protein [Acidobacteria bacterium]|nr:sulfite exporter TauE/SafE family protein [Acidobacteriota bacterium]
MPWPEILAVVFPTPWHFLVACVALFVAELVYVLLGFGSGLIAVGTLALVLPEIRDVVVLVLLINLPAEVFVVWTSRREIRRRGVLLLAIGIVVGIPVGAWILSFGEPIFLLGILGLVLVAIGGVFLALPNGAGVRMPAVVGPIAGLISGLLTGLFGTGGPPLVLFFRIQGLTKAAFRGNLMVLFLMMGVIRLPSYIALGLITPVRLVAGAAVLPAVLAGGVVGHLIHLDLSEKTFRRIVSAALVVLGLLLLVR